MPDTNAASRTRVRLSCGCEDDLPTDPDIAWTTGDFVLCDCTDTDLVEIVEVYANGN